MSSDFISQALDIVQKKFGIDEGKIKELVCTLFVKAPF
jgi:hypothetical protein